MPDESQTSGKAAAEEKPTYHRDRLIAEAGDFFGQPSQVVAGALSRGRLATKVNFTRDEVEKAIKEHLDHEVELDYNQDGEE